MENMEEVFAKIDRIDWIKLEAANVPTWLRDLASNDLEKQSRAYDALDSLYVTANSESWENYGSASEVLKTDAPIFIVPILIDFLNIDDLNNKGMVLQLLWDLGRIGQINRHENRVPYSIRAEKVYEAVQAGIHLYSSLIDSKDTLIAGLAGDLGGLFK